MFSLMTVVRITILGIMLSVAAVAQGPISSADWVPVYEEDFSDDSWRKTWKLDGLAEISMEKEEEIGFLKVKTLGSEMNARDQCSTLWLRKRLQGDLLIKFRARADAGSRALLYFNANTTERSGYKSLFDWERPDSKMLRYAGTGLMELYSIGILRGNQEICNFRYLGGPEMSKLFVAQRPVFSKVSVLANYESPFVDKPDNTWFEFELEVHDNHVTFDVDGRRVIEHVDTGMVDLPSCRWDPLTNGGCIALRNFKATAVCLDYIRVFQAKRE